MSCNFAVRRLVSRFGILRQNKMLGGDCGDHCPSCLLCYQMEYKEKCDAIGSRFSIHLYMIQWPLFDIIVKFL